LIGRSETFIRWALFGAVTLLLLLLQGFVLQFVTIWGVMPFLYPVLVAVLAMWEGSVPGAVYGLVLGLLCDLTLPGPIPCLYTLIFPLVGLFAAVLSKSWLPAGFWCSLVVSVLAFVLTDAAHVVLLAARGHAAWSAAALTAGKETLATLLFVPVVYLVFRSIHRLCHRDD
jgi:rod shape-determining protein MreD